MEDNKQNVLLSVAKAADISGLSARTLQKYISSGQLSARKIGRRRLIELARLREFLAEDRPVSQSSTEISCAQFMALQVRRAAALAALSADPVLPSQLGVTPSQDKVLRELECTGLALRAHASECGGCYLNHHLTPSQVQIEIEAPDGEK